MTGEVKSAKGQQASNEKARFPGTFQSFYDADY
jgi:hypothetical protein